MYNTVPMKYHHKTRLGNWYEEWELEETKYIFSLKFSRLSRILKFRMKDYLQKKTKSELDCEKVEKKLLHSLEKVF